MSFHKPSHRLLGAFLITITTLSMNAVAGLLDDEEARKDIKNLRAQVLQQNRENDARLQLIEDSVKNLGIIQLLNQIEQLNAEIAKLRGQVEVMSNLDEQLTKRQRDFYLDIDTRLRKLEGGSPEPPAGASATSAIPAVASAVAPPAPLTAAQAAALRAKESSVYDVGANSFKRGDYAAAIRAFQTFIKDYPTGLLVSNANYWMGISYFNLKDYGNARSTQEGLLKKFPDSPKAPDALLAIASIYTEMGDNGSARNTLEDVIAKYPASEASAKARARLPAMKR